MGSGLEDPTRHYKMCETIWIASGQMNKDYWLRAFPTTLWGIAIDWFIKLDDEYIVSWDALKKAFKAKFKLL